MPIHRHLLLAITLVSATGRLIAADAFGYTATSNAAFSYVNVSTEGASILAGDDDSSATLSLPFTFRFYGIGYNSRVCPPTG